MGKDVELVMITGINVRRNEIFLASLYHDLAETYPAEHEEAVAFDAIYNKAAEKGLFLLAKYDRKENVLIHEMD